MTLTPKYPIATIAAYEIATGKPVWLGDRGANSTAALVSDSKIYESGYATQDGSFRSFIREWDGSGAILNENWDYPVDTDSGSASYVRELRESGDGRILAKRKIHSASKDVVMWYDASVAYGSQSPSFNAGSNQNRRSFFGRSGDGDVRSGSSGGAISRYHDDTTVTTITTSPLFGFNDFSEAGSGVYAGLGQFLKTFDDASGAIANTAAGYFHVPGSSVPAELIDSNSNYVAVFCDTTDAGNDGITLWDTSLAQIWQVNPATVYLLRVNDSGTVYAAGISNAYCLDASTGSTTWSTSISGVTAGSAPNQLLVQDGNVYVCGTLGVMAIDEATGSVLWTQLTGLIVNDLVSDGTNLYAVMNRGSIKAA